MIKQIREEKAKLEVAISNKLYEFEQKHGVKVMSIKGIIDKDFSDSVSSVEIKIEI